MPSSRFHGASGSTATKNAEKIRRVIMRFNALPSAEQTSEGFTAIWDDRDSLIRDDTMMLDYLHHSAFGNNSSGWFRYYKALVGSTWNTSTQGSKFPAGFSLPTQLWRDWVELVPIGGESTNTDADRGDHVYQILQDTNQDYSKDTPLELVCAWAGAGQTSVDGSASSARSS